MANSLDSIFEDDAFDDLTKQVEKKKVVKQDPEVAKFQEIIDFVNENGREPEKTPEWSSERALWARLSGFRVKPERSEKVKKYDTLGLLEKEFEPDGEFLADSVEIDDELNLDDILGSDDMIDDFSDLLDVSRYRRTVNAADKIGRRKHASHFEKYKSLFDQVHADIASGRRKIIPFEQYDIHENRFYIQNGVMMYIVSISKDTFIADNGKTNARMHVVYENGTENKNLLLQSLASSLYSTERHGRMVTEPVDEETLAESFGEEFTTGYIYVLKSLSTNPDISKWNNLYKIGFTRNDVESRIANAENDVTYLNAPVKVMLSAEVQNVNAQLLERTLHHVFQDKQVVFQDGNFKKATEWYMVPLNDIESKINEVIAGLQK
ncbi:GIY-YIG nuclease family protein [Enterococcus faecalis]|uniref:GIY-YIG nuclease family protein n=1 Tax=Enterococcus faecalis TaxID=1351 RepID=UPI0019FCF57A|nr:GIY-YIG nuclease family protein [Enterococcus faecalis]EGO8510296.1 GIY-YIG nuclease family protein [Enterococcus faecalis]EGO8994526.1 GIY-YIG nuclease family protein [Enterococcus faecalis]EGQ7426817.1 GIY-YIG nuclease family protein [Enterococcus faecalis]